MAQTKLFKYTLLDLDRSALRLLRLKAAGNKPTRKRKRSMSANESQSDDEVISAERGPEIECELIEAFFDVDFVPDYEAVSYTWGSADNPRAISVDGSKFLVTYNLWSLLHDIRYQSEDRILWIDAICIDQANDRERGHQVQQMDRIYRFAQRVILARTIDRNDQHPYGFIGET
ncbi:HET-domain-containing protein [Apiospora rasikravindrae]|uniref:HET-domain-containing protein n=1 Tax=Apiospora rasikravindrae TaxID=990691 RepID=A0ABR1RXP7_9PEZI